MKMNNSLYLPAEWHRQSAVQLTWPHEGTDWAPLLKDVEECYLCMAKEIARRARLIVVTPHPTEVGQLLKDRLGKELRANISLYEITTDDTWARDHGFLTLLDTEGGKPHLLDFRFNAWGQKFPSAQDNLICRRMAEMGAVEGVYESHQDFVLEGGSIESDGKGTLLTTASCLLSPNRNEPLSLGQIEKELKRRLHAERVLWLHHGYLAGDDTDSHVDTLARLCPEDTIAYVQCMDTEDEHYKELTLMEEELKRLTTREGKPYRLVPLPMAAPMYDEEGGRLPATYANFLITNGAVLMPTYAHPQLDHEAREQLQKAFPEYEIVGIDCRVLVTQHGSLHCSTMQYPC